MTNDTVTLHGFAYGEHLEGPQQRSLGYRLLAPAEPKEWCSEVETLARRLHAAPYPDHWPPIALFCSVLLADGRRVVAVARYGLADHTPSQRRGGLELIGAVGPGGLGVPSALAIGHWLRERRTAADDLRGLGGQFTLSDVLNTIPPVSPPREPVPVLPIRLWQEGALLFAATAPSDPDQRLGLLEQGATGTWQWLPLVGADFPIQTFAQRGPLVAWTPHLAGVAVKLDRKPTEETVRSTPRRRKLAAVLGVALVLLLAANFWATLDVQHRLSSRNSPAPGPPGPAPSSTGEAANRDARERFAQALYRLLQKQTDLHDGSQGQLIRHYERLAVEDDGLRVASQEGKLAVGSVSVLARRSPKQIEALVREALANKGYDPQLIDLVCRRVKERLGAEDRDGP
jgi:hypothetical protein